jgi:alanine dehydrogenase
VIGAVLARGSRAPALIRREHLATMRPGSVLVDVSIDQGGCFETSRPTTHAAPISTVDGIHHYCVANLPGTVLVTSTQALTSATLPYVVRLAELGLRGAVGADPGLAAGVSVVGGTLTSPPVARDQGLACAPVLEQLAA